MTAGYSKTPLVKKLGIKPGFTVLLVNEPANLRSLLGELPEDVSFVDQSSSPVDYIHFFTKEKTELLAQIGTLKSAIKKDGLLWISWPKKASKVPTDVTEALVRETGLNAGLVDVKICAVDEIWSGLKFVYRLKDR